MQDKWIVTLTVQMSVKGATSRADAIFSAEDRVKEYIRNKKGVPFKCNAKRINEITDEEPLFGKKWE